MIDSPLLSVVAAPVLLPIVALLNLLFPGILRDQWRQYQFVVKVLLAQSTLIFLHWALCRWVFTPPPWWLSEAVLWAALVVVALYGALRSLQVRARLPVDEPDPAAGPPRPIEYWALGILAVAGLANAWWSGWQLDPMTPVAAGAVLGFLHLLTRRFIAPATEPRRAWVATETVVTWSLVLVGAWLGLYLHQATGANLQAAEVRTDWSTFRGGPDRAGTANTADAGPAQPAVLWTFDPQERSGLVHFHSSPTVVDGQVYVGALHQVLSFTQGYLYCINAATRRQIGERPINIGERIWRFDSDETLKPVFSSPTVVGGKLYFGEGYHQDRDCRLFCLDARDASKVAWAMPTTSHVESSPTVVGSRVYFGAGDDGIYCVDGKLLEPPSAADGVPRPRTLWHVEKVHVDASPTVVGNRLFVGSVLGDVYQEFVALAIDTDTGEVVWRFDSNFPLPAAPAYSAHDGGRVLFTLGNGKVNEDAAVPEGGLVCVAAATGKRMWRVPAGNSVLSSPVVMGDRVYFAARDKHCYGVKIADGEVTWKCDLGAPVVASPIASGGRLYVLTVEGVLFALDAASGDIVWQFDRLKTPAADAYSSPTLVDGKLFVAIGGKVYCLGDVAVP